MINIKEIASGWPENTNDELSLIQIGLENESTLRVNLVRRHDRQEPQVRPRTNILNFGLQQGS